ncbi:MAG: hypothetical protein HY902_17010 [Deltaproteobacteria bacterium]|nr:hypothetical protein [Deltaproteobacteria bacterium]
MPWKKSKDPLFRGDDRARVRRPHPGADPRVVRHILQLDGLGTESPYLSTTESVDAAEHFANPKCRVWETKAPTAESEGVGHMAKKELLQALRPKGTARYAWPSPHEILVARTRVEKWSEHLLDFATRPDDAALDDTLSRIFA